MKAIIASQQGELAGELVLLRQELDRPLVGGDDADDVAGDDGERPCCRPGTSGGTRASTARTSAPVPKMLLPLLSGSLAWTRVWVPISTK